jgi:PTH1 family peptidyl-tRNA hydrolase
MFSGKVIFGIGNPGSRYQNNRHNTGFLFLDYFASIEKINFVSSSGDYYVASCKTSSKNYALIKPTTFVNNSGIVAEQIIKVQNINIKDFLVISDDINLTIGTFRVRLAGGDGGHNGLSSIIYHLNSDKFPRIRIGVGTEMRKNELSDFVLSDFSKDEFDILRKTFNDTSLLVWEFIIGGSEQMLKVNSKLTKENKKNIQTSNSKESSLD